MCGCYFRWDYGLPSESSGIGSALDSRTHPCKRWARPGYRRSRLRSRTRSLGNRVGATAVVTGRTLFVVDVADAQIPSRGLQAGPHIVARTPAHPRTFSTRIL